MKTVSQKELEQNLAGYLAHVEYWDADQGDSFLMLNCRELLSENESVLTSDQKKQMQLADKKILTLADVSYEEDTPDVGFLRLTAGVIIDHPYQQAA